MSNAKEPALTRLGDCESSTKNLSFDLLSPPSEVRNRVYDFSLDHGIGEICRLECGGIRAVNYRRSMTELWKSLMLTNHQIHDETNEQLTATRGRFLHIKTRDLRCAKSWAINHPKLAEKISCVSFEFGFHLTGPGEVEDYRTKEDWGCYAESMVLGPFKVNWGEKMEVVVETLESISRAERMKRYLLVNARLSGYMVISKRKTVDVRYGRIESRTGYESSSSRRCYGLTYPSTSSADERNDVGVRHRV
jgi:hypothetical protein